MNLDSLTPHLRALAAPIQIEFLKWGKLVSGQDERVPYDEGYAITRRSRGLPASRQRLNCRSLLGVSLNPYHFCPESVRDGVFVLRFLPAADPTSQPGLVMVRARFLSEAGNKVQGRSFELSEFWVVEREDWLKAPGTILTHARKHLLALPDSIEEQAATRLKDDPILLPDASYERPRDAFAQFDSTPPETVALLQYLLTRATPLPLSPPSRAEFGSTSFPDEAAFLDCLAEAFDILASLGSSPAAAGRVRSMLEGVTVITGYSGQSADLGPACVTYRPIPHARPTVNRAQTRQALAALIEPPSSAPLLSAALLYWPMHGGATVDDDRMAPVSLERFARSFDAARRQPKHEALNNLMEDARTLILGDASFVETRNRRSINRLDQPAWRFLVGLAAASSPAQKMTGANFLDLWTTLVILVRDPDENRFAPILSEVIRRLLEIIRTQAILIPKELAALDGEDDSADNFLGERALQRLNVIRQRLMCDQHLSEVGPGGSLLEASRNLARWLAGAEGGTLTGILDLETRDGIVRRLLVRFEPANWSSLDLGANGAFAIAFMPAAVVSNLVPSSQGIGAANDLPDEAELIAQQIGEATIRLATLTGRMIGFVQRPIYPRPLLWEALSS